MLAEQYGDINGKTLMGSLPAMRLAKIIS